MLRTTRRSSECRPSLVGSLVAITASACLLPLVGGCKISQVDEGSTAQNNGTANVNPELSSTVELDLENGAGRCTGSIIDLARFAAMGVGAQGVAGVQGAQGGADLYVLTAAHCVVRFTAVGQAPRMITPIDETALPSEIEIPLGLGGAPAPMVQGFYTVLKPVDVKVSLGLQMGGINVLRATAVKTIVVHPTWDPAQANVAGAQGQRLPAANDLAVLILNKPANVGVAALPLASALPQVADMVHFSGFGQTSAIDATGSGALREGTNTIAAVALGQGQVLATVGPLPAPTPQGLRPAAAAPGQVICGAGDSGGPLAAQVAAQNINIGDVVGVLHGGKPVRGQAGGQDYVCVFASIAEASNTRFLQGAAQAQAQGAVPPAGGTPKPAGDEAALEASATEVATSAP